MIRRNMKREKKDCWNAAHAISKKEETYSPGEWAKVADIRSGSVSFVFPVIIISTRFQLVHATFFN